MLAELKMAFRFTGALGDFLHQPLSPEVARTQLSRQLADRDESFLRMLDRSVFGFPRSPYLALLKQAAIQFDHIREWVHQKGVEGALEQLYAEGIYVTLDEFKGRKPIQRAKLNLAVSDEDFDNPLLKKHYEATTGGTTEGVGKRLVIDLDLLAYEAAYDYFFLETTGALDYPMIIWRPIPPGSAGMKTVLRRAKLGKAVAHWFSQSRVDLQRENSSHTLFTWYATLAGRLLGYPMPAPKYLPLDQAAVVARRLAHFKAEGQPPFLDTNVGSAIRVCLAAKDERLDIAGTVMRIGSESYTPAKAALIADMGVRALAHYAMSEASRMGGACGNSIMPDEVHVFQDKAALIQRTKQLSSGENVGALYCSTLHLSTPKLMLNVELGDYGTLLQRDCGCILGELGLSWHLHSIRSYEKLTTEGMHFVSADLLHLIEEVLPKQFGGSPTDYQLVSEEAGELSKVSLYISPRVGEVNEAEAITATLHALGEPSSGNQLMANYWRDGRTLDVVRREPYSTRLAKIPPLHIIRTAGETRNELGN